MVEREKMNLKRNKLKSNKTDAILDESVFGFF